MAVKQGDLDSLCGIYAIINAIGLLFPLTAKDRRKLFKRLVYMLEKHYPARHAMLHGTRRRHINRMLNAAVKHMHGRHGMTLTIEKPFTRNRGITIPRFWRKLQYHLQKQPSAAIISLNGKISHWVCVRGITTSTLLLEDSGGKGHVRKQRCRISGTYTDTHYHLLPKDCWLLSISNTP